MATKEFYNIGERDHVREEGSSGDDLFLIGGEKPYTFHHGILPASIIKRHNRGNIGALIGQGTVEVDTGDGNDRIDTGLNAYDNKIDWSATINPGNIWQNATIKMGNGNDVLNVGKPHTDPEAMDWHVFLGANIHGAHIFMGMGDDTISVSQDVDGAAVIYTDDPGDDAAPDDFLPRSVGGGHKTGSSSRELVSPLTGGDDTLIIGGTVGDISNSLFGNSPRIYMGGGDDKLRVAGPVWADSLIDMGEGNNDGRVRSLRMSAKMLFGNGDDVLNVDKNITDFSRVEMDDAGSDKVDDGYNPPLDNPYPPSSGTGGTGNDILNVGDDITSFSSVDMGGGDNQLHVGGSIRFNAQVVMGSGNDEAYIKDSVRGWSYLNLGDGDNKLSINNNVTDFAKVVMGEGNDHFVADKLLLSAQVDLGDGDNVATVNAIDQYAKMFFGKGDDQLTIKDSFGFFAVQDRLLLKETGAKVYMGEGDDTVTYGGKTLTGVIYGGEGKDTFILNYDHDDSLTTGMSAWKNVTNLSTLNIKGFEVIKMEGNNVVDVKYTDLLHDDSREGALYIQGNSNSKVDLGGTDWSSDTDTYLKEHYKYLDPFDIINQGEWKKAETGVNVDGIEYDVYRHDAAGTDTHNDVYIQTGIMVI